MQLGTYLASFLRIYINTNLEIDNMKGANLTDYEKRIFIHEYTHFLQNITGGFGLLHAWNIYDRLRQQIAELQQSEEKEIIIPLTGATSEEQIRYYWIRKRIEGSYKVKKEMQDSSTKVINIRLEKDHDIEILYPKRKPIHHLILELEDDIGNTMNYTFGEAAVSETMALLMESKYFETDPADNFPYHVCRILAKYMGTDLQDNDEFLFALCDVSLLSSFPGVMFYRILSNMQTTNFVPENAEQVFDYGLDFMSSDGWNIMGDYENNMEGATHVINLLLSNQIFNEIVEWIVYLFRTGFNCRSKNKYFFIQLYREPIVFEGFWNNIIALFGNPEICNNTKKRAFTSPVALKSIEGKIEPILMMALHEVHETLFKGKTNCALFEFCKHSTNGLKVDDRCLATPWERALDKPSCAYGALWASFGINDKNIKLSQ